MNTRSPLYENRTSPARPAGALRFLTRSEQRKPRTPADLIALNQELRSVREQSLNASRRGDYVAQGRLTVEAARLNQAIAEAQQMDA